MPACLRQSLVADPRRGRADRQCIARDVEPALAGGRIHDGDLSLHLGCRRVGDGDLERAAGRSRAIGNTRRRFGDRQSFALRDRPAVLTAARVVSDRTAIVTRRCFRLDRHDRALLRRRLAGHSATGPTVRAIVRAVAFGCRLFGEARLYFHLARVLEGAEGAGRQLQTCLRLNFGIGRHRHRRLAASEVLELDGLLQRQLHVVGAEFRLRASFQLLGARGILLV